MRAALVGRYPRVDTPAWKQRVAEGLVAAGYDMVVVYSRSRLRDQIQAGAMEMGPAEALKRYTRIRHQRDSAAAVTTTDQPYPTLGAWAAANGAPIMRFDRCLTRDA